MGFQLGAISEVVYCVGDMAKAHHFFCKYGGMTSTDAVEIGNDLLKFWNLPEGAQGIQRLVQFDDHETGRIRLVSFSNVAQRYIRSSQQPWDTGGIMDINLRVNEVSQTFDDLRDLGWHGLSDPLFQKMGPFELYDILMKGYDDIIIAFTHRTQPPLELKQGFNIPSHVYNSSVVVKDIQKAGSFYLDQMGFQLLNEYEVVKDTPQENMFGIPFNVIPNVRCEANIISLDGDRDTVFQLIQFHGVSGKDFSAHAIPPNRGLLMYRCEVSGVKDYFDYLQGNGVAMTDEMSRLEIAPYGTVQCFSVVCPDGVRWEFFEKV